MLPSQNDHRTSSLRAKNSVWSSGISMESATEQGLRTQQLVTLPDSLLRGFSLQNGELTHSKSFAPSADSKAFVTDLLLILCSLQRSSRPAPGTATRVLSACGPSLALCGHSGWCHPRPQACLSSRLCAERQISGPLALCQGWKMEQLQLGTIKKSLNCHANQQSHS